MHDLIWNRTGCVIYKYNPMQRFKHITLACGAYYDQFSYTAEIMAVAFINDQSNTHF
jgi:hypothetical protein